MIRILHASDVHFGAPYLPEAGEAFQEAAHALDPDAIVVSGDFTQRAKVQEYQAARAYLDRLPDVPLVVTPGNHDVPLYRIWERIAAPFRNYRDHIHPDLDVVTRIEGVTIVSLNSAAPHTAIVNGRISRGQLEFAEAAFAQSPADDARIVVLHHHLSPAPDYEPDRPLPGAPRILDTLEDMGVEIVMAGHLHRAYIGNSMDVRPRPGSHKGVLIVHSGTTSSRRGRAREKGRQTFNLVLLGKEVTEVHHYMFFPDRGRFEVLGLHAFPRGAARFFTGADVTADRLTGGSR